jgi:perosamine synthetase
MNIENYIPVNEPVLNGKEKEYLIKCIESGWISSEGPLIKEFEEKFASRVGRKYGIAVCNGTAAIDAAIEALELSKGDEVILPSFTIISCIAQIVRSGLKPVLVDSDPITWNMDIGQIESRINKKTKAIMIVHIYGLPVDVEPVLELARRYNLNVIEDAAEMHGQTYKGQPCGCFGDISTFSFYPNKHITTGEGGMIVTDSYMYAERCRSLRNLCFQQHKRFVHERLGWNLRMTSLQAAIGLAQLERLDEFVARKRQTGALYARYLGGNENIQIPLQRTEYADNIYWVNGVVININTGINAKQAMHYLAEKGIGTRPFFFPMHKQPVFEKLGLFEGEFYPISEYLSQQGFYLPSGMAVTEDQVSHACDVFKDFLNTVKKQK